MAGNARPTLLARLKTLAQDYAMEFSYMARRKGLKEKIRGLPPVLSQPY
jgi:hypothetical protein